MDDLQFFPTPKRLARRAWKKFKNQNFVRVLEPHAGNGDLAEANPWKDDYYHSRRMQIDCCEIDVRKHDVLRSKGLHVVGMDFLQFGNGAIYSHVIMNPPFAEGAKHVLKAWDVVWSAEITAYVNAETIRNPYSQERQRLVKLIEQFGEVEFIEKGFSMSDAERKTDVEVALVYLCKEADVEHDILGDLLGDLRRDAANAETLAGGYRQPNELALPSSYVENTVLAFEAAVRSMREALFAEAKANYYASLLGETMGRRDSEEATSTKDTSVEWVQRKVGEQYDKLKDKAWANVLRSTNVTSRLSSGAQRRVEHEFEQIKRLEFTVANIYGFLCGLAESQGQIQIGMICDVFDQITKYHTDNTHFFRGWVSNDKHRTCGMKIKTTRFILPGHSTQSYQSSLDWNSQQLLTDFDKVFALLDGGKSRPEVGLVDVFRSHFSDLRHGVRVSSSYFDVRYYPGIGTIHFFARDKALVDRLNRIVGRHRQWLPPEGTRVSEAFWLQYDQAEKLDKEVRREVQKDRRSFWDDPLQRLFHGSQDERSKAGASIDAAITRVLKQQGISVDYQIEESPSAKPPLLLQAA